jgi:hypothetical protein
LRPAASGARDASGAALVARLGLDPRRDLDGIVLAAASTEGGDRERGAELLLLARGRFDRDRVVAALGRGGELVRRRVRGHALYTPRESASLSLLFLEASAGTRVLAVVTAGWRERLLDRLEGRGRSALAGRTLGAELRASRQVVATMRLASRLSPALSRLLARRAGWPELASVATSTGAARAGDRLELELQAGLVESSGAAALGRRIVELGRGLAPSAKVEGRMVTIRAALGREALRAVLERLGDPSAVEGR